MSAKNKNNSTQSGKKSTREVNIRREPGTKDDRQAQRVPVQLLVDYHANGNYLFDFCKDLGTGGVFIETKNPLASGSTVSLTFTLPDSKETLETKGRVIWVQSEVPEKNATAGMGVQFEGFDNHQRKLLEEFVARYHAEGLNKKNEKSSA